MDKIDLRLIFILVSYGLFALILLSIPLRRKIACKKTGEKIMNLTSSSIVYKIFIYILALGLISILWIRNFGPMMNFVLCGCSVLATELMTRDIVLYKKYGLYKNGIIYDGGFVSYKSIIALPVLALPEDEQKNYDSKTLVFVSDKKGKKAFTFMTEEECKAVVEKMFELEPELKKLI